MSSKAFIERNKTVGVASAEWKSPKGKPDHPNYWTKCHVRLEDGSRYVLDEAFVRGGGMRWMGDPQLFSNAQQTEGGVDKPKTICAFCRGLDGRHYTDCPFPDPFDPYGRSATEQQPAPAQGVDRFPNGRCSDLVLAQRVADAICAPIVAKNPQFKGAGLLDAVNGALGICEEHFTGLAPAQPVNAMLVDGDGGWA